MSRSTPAGRTRASRRRFPEHRPARPRGSARASQLNIVNDTTLAEVGDGASVTGLDDLTVRADSTSPVTTEARGGVAAERSPSRPCSPSRSRTSEPSPGSAPATRSILTGGYTGTATQRAPVSTIAAGNVDAQTGAAVGIVIALTFADHFVRAELARDVTAAGAVALTATGAVSTSTQASSSATGAPGDGAQATPAQQAADVRAYADGLAPDAGAAGDGTGGSGSTPNPAPPSTPQGTVTVAAALALNIHTSVADVSVTDIQITALVRRTRGAREHLVVVGGHRRPVGPRAPERHHDRSGRRDQRHGCTRPCGGRPLHHHHHRFPDTRRRDRRAERVGDRRRHPPGHRHRHRRPRIGRRSQRRRVGRHRDRGPSHHRRSDRRDASRRHPHGRAPVVSITATSSLATSATASLADAGPGTPTTGIGAAFALASVDHETSAAHRRWRRRSAAPAMSRSPPRAATPPRSEAHGAARATGVAVAPFTAVTLTEVAVAARIGAGATPLADRVADPRRAAARDRDEPGPSRRGHRDRHRRRRRRSR